MLFRNLAAAVATVGTTIIEALLLIALVAAGPVFGQTTEPPATGQTEPASKIPNDQLDSLVAPIALYPDPLLAQMLAASTYPLEVIQLEQWLKRHGNLKQDALAVEVAKQTWDPSVQALAIYPEVVTRLSANVAWTTDLGNAFLAEPSEVMAAIQRMRAKAQSKGTLKTGEQQTVETEMVEGGGEVITIEPANPQYGYIPSYDMEVVYGPPYYPYPPYYYPGYVPGMGLAFGTGIILGAAWANHWGDCNWGHGDLTINHHNNFNKNNINNINTGNRNQAGGGKWQHNPTHRGGAPYGDRNTAGKYGGRARQQPAGGTGNRGSGGSLGSNRPGGASGIGGGNRPGTGAGGAGGLGGIGPNRADGSNVFNGGNRAGGGGGRGNSGGRDAFSNNVFGDRAGAGGGNRPSAGTGAGANRRGGSVTTMPANRGGGGTQRIGERGISSGGGFGSSNNTFGGGGFGGSSARSASNRGGYSMGGGGFSGGGGRGGGGMRGGGGGGRRR